MNDIANNVPGLTASPSGSQGLRFTLRGVGARDSQLGVESKVGKGSTFSIYLPID